MRPLLLLLALLLTGGAVLAQGKGQTPGERRGGGGAPAMQQPAPSRQTASATAPPAVPPGAAPAPGQMNARGPTRIDFDDRLVQGQTNKLGAVYLYQRKSPAQQSLLSRRQSFRDEIARDLLE